MKLLLNLTLVLSFIAQMNAQTTLNIEQDYSSYFETAYQSHPNIPKGVLEAIAYNHTHVRHIVPEQEMPSCMGLPAQYGVMGMVLDGQGYFKNNLVEVANRSDFSIEEIRLSAESNILAYAAAYADVLEELNITASTIEAQIPVLIYLSELPEITTMALDFKTNYALQTQIYGILDFLNKPVFQQQYNFPERSIDFKPIFGEENLKVLSASHIFVSDNGIENEVGDQFNGNTLLSADYPPAIWNPAATCNYSSRNGTPISAVTIHTIQGSYAGAISWFQNCSASVSAHYVIRSSDGQVTQMVLEADKAWHVGSENPYTIGFEHEGYINDASWYTDAMYESSADIAKDIVNSGYGINPLRTYNGPGCTGGSTTCQLGGCIKIKGHQHYANQSHTDPGINWDWVKYYNLINDGTTVNIETATAGTICDSGGSAGNYSDDERTLLEISPTNAISITLDFTSFDLEVNWDYLTIYDGATVNDPIVGTYTGTTSPGMLTINNSSILIEFRSDCATNNPGYCFNWTSQLQDMISPTTSINAFPTPVQSSFQVTFNDADDAGGSGVNDAYYLVTDHNGTERRANADYGFYYDDFPTVPLHTDWTTFSGIWQGQGNGMLQTDANEGNSNIYVEVNQNLVDNYMYEWNGTISGTGTNQRAGIHFFCDDAATTNRNNSYFMYFRESSNKLQLYKVVNDTWTLEVDIPYSFNLNQAYSFKIFFNKTTGLIDIYVDDIKALSWTDTSPHTVGNYVSFRSGNCVYLVENFRVYRSRSVTETITVGNSPTNMIRYEDPANGTQSGAITTIIRDNACNLSPKDTEFFEVDFDVCPINIYENGIVAPGIYQAAQGVHSSGTINTSLNVSFLGNYVDLLPGFQSNTDFTAEIAPCN